MQTTDHPLSRYRCYGGLGNEAHQSDLHHRRKIILASVRGFYKNLDFDRCDDSGAVDKQKNERKLNHIRTESRFGNMRDLPAGIRKCTYRILPLASVSLRAKSKPLLRDDLGTMNMLALNRAGTPSIGFEKQ